MAGHRRSVLCGSLRSLTTPRRYVAARPMEPGLCWVPVAVSASATVELETVEVYLRGGIGPIGEGL